MLYFVIMKCRYNLLPLYFVLNYNVKIFILKIDLEISGSSNVTNAVIFIRTPQTSELTPQQVLTLHVIIFERKI